MIWFIWKKSFNNHLDFHVFELWQEVAVLGQVENWLAVYIKVDAADSA